MPDTEIPKSPNPGYLKALPRELLSPSPSALGRLLPGQDPVDFWGLPSQVMLLGTGHGHCLAGNNIHKSLKSACRCVYIYIMHILSIYVYTYVCEYISYTCIYHYIPRRGAGLCTGSVHHSGAPFSWYQEGFLVTADISGLFTISSWWSVCAAKCACRSRWSFKAPWNHNQPIHLSDF